MQHQPSQLYSICVEGRLDTSWSVWFEGLQVVVATTAPGITTLVGKVRDQAELYGHLCKIRDMGLTLLSLQRMEADVAPASSYTLF